VALIVAKGLLNLEVEVKESSRLIPFLNKVDVLLVKKFCPTSFAVVSSTGLLKASPHSDRNKSRVIVFFIYLFV
jgi:hypothetical protein